MAVEDTVGHVYSMTSEIAENKINFFLNIKKYEKRTLGRRCGRANRDVDFAVDQDRGHGVAEIRARGA